MTSMHGDINCSSSASNKSITIEELRHMGISCSTISPIAFDTAVNSVHWECTQDRDSSSRSQGNMHSSNNHTRSSWVSRQACPSFANIITLTPVELVSVMNDSESDIRDLQGEKICYVLMKGSGNLDIEHEDGIRIRIQLKGGHLIIFPEKFYHNFIANPCERLDTPNDLCARIGYFAGAIVDISAPLVRVFVESNTSKSHLDNAEERTTPISYHACRA
mmetsp:Transcript_23237/g.34466  ORF Transcript_23237/g.34466 Transcript_23237/m.34466 type:complete len:219 (+) Transcript_23237:1-657(+)